MFINKFKYLNKKKKKGSISLFLIALLLLISVIGTSLATLAQTTLGTNSSTKITLQAQQYAEAEAAIIKTTKYNKLTPLKREPIDNTIYEKEIQISDETENEDNINQKIVSILVYRLNEETPSYILNILRLQSEAKSDIPIGTIIAWPSNINPLDGIWLECNGQSCAGYPQLVAVLGKNTVPDYRGRFLEGSNNAGTKKEAGLPNIVGQFVQGNWSGNFTKGAFYQTGAMGGPCGHEGDWRYIGFFDASRCSTVYGNSDTVQPASITVRYLIKASD